MKYLNFKNNPSKKLRTNTGFTLVEMMVAIAVFSIVMVTAMSALLNVVDANNKARALKTAINNISFALEGISKDMRMGTDYGCLDNLGNPTVCSLAGNDGIYFKSSKTNNPYVYFLFKGNQMQSCLGGSTGGVCSGIYSGLTSLEVKLTRVKFYVLNDDSSTPEREQPRAIITISGQAGSKAKLITDFDLQTSISQRMRISTILP